MCRWIVYQGPPIYLETVLLEPGHSLIDQSLHAREIEWPTNGDGFGVGWYGSRDQVAVFRDVLPIWNDDNLRVIAHQTRSHLFFAHIRKATGGAIQRTNCHPFAYERWLFQHNGSIPAFERLRQSLYARIDPHLFERLEGSTDSECMFYIALSNGLIDDPPAGLAAMIDIVEDARNQAGLGEPFLCTAAVSDGQTTYAVRHASVGQPRSLYVSNRPDALCDLDGCTTHLPERAMIIASEPLGTLRDAWTLVPPSTILAASAGDVRTISLSV